MKREPVGVFPKENIRWELTNDCDEFLKEALRIATESFGSTAPQRTVVSGIMVPSGPGNYTSKDLTSVEPDWHRIWTQIQERLRATQVWTQAKESLQRYLDVHQIKPTGLRLHMIEEQYLRPLFD